MIQKDINTGIKVPTGSRCGWTEKDTQELTDFETAMVEYLGLPGNWKQYFKFGSSNDFIILQENTFYKADYFRKFKRGKEATIQADLKERINDHIKYKTQSKAAATEKQDREANYKEIVKGITGRDNEWLISYHNENEGLQISLLVECKNWNDEPEMKQVASVYINHTGIIKEPEFSCHIRYSASLSQAQRFIDQYSDYNNKLMAKAQEVKELLPKEYYTN